MSSLPEENKNLSAAPASTEDEVHLQDYLHVLLRRRKVFLTTFLLVFFAVVVVTFLMRPVYEATTTLHVGEDKSKNGDFMAELGLSSQSPVETEIEIIKARTNVEEVIRRLQLDWRDPDVSSELQLFVSEFETANPKLDYLLTKTNTDSYRIADSTGAIIGEGVVGKRLEKSQLLLKIERLEGRTGATTTLRRAWLDAYVRDFRDKITAIEVGKGTSIIQVGFQHNDPGLAKDVVNTLIQVYLERSIALKAEEARKSVEFIEGQLGDVRKQLENAEKGLQDFKREAGTVRLDTEAENLVNRIADAEKERSMLALRKRQAEFAMDGLESALRKKSIYSPAALLDDPVIASLAKNLADLEVERQGLLTEHTESHPRIRAIHERIVEIEQKMLATYKSQRDTMQDRIVAIEAQIRQGEEQLLKLPLVEQELARLTRLAKVNADIYTFLLQKHEEARIARAATISNVNVIDPAILPAEPVKPRKLKNLLAGLAAGLMLGLGMAFFLEYMDDTIKDGEQVKRIFGYPLLAVIPHIGERRRGDERSRSSAAEAFRSLRTNLHFVSSAHKRPIFLVTSSFPNEGKSTISANMAMAIAQTEAKVLLIGCDLRRPSLSRLIEEAHTPGLTEYLVGDAPLSAVVRDTSYKNLYFIPSGAIPPNPAELLNSDAMRTLLDEARKEYQCIIIDSPPMFAVTDAALISSLCDLVLLVVSIGRVPVKVAKRLRENCDRLQTPVGGLILNDMSGKGSEYYGYYGEGYYYGAYDYASDEEMPKSGFWSRLTSWLRH